MFDKTLARNWDFGQDLAKIVSEKISAVFFDQKDYVLLQNYDL